jgi:hypothetical protein
MQKLAAIGRLFCNCFNNWFLYSKLHLCQTIKNTNLTLIIFNLLIIRKVLTNKSQFLNVYMKANRLFL